MIRPLRQRHLWMHAVLALAVALVLLQGIRLRAGIPADTKVPSTSINSNAGQDFVDVVVPANLIKPDVLAYLCATAPEGKDLPVDAILLGSVSGSSGNRLALPSSMPIEARFVVLYSLGHQEVIDVKPFGESE